MSTVKQLSKASVLETIPFVDQSIQLKQQFVLGVNSRRQLVFLKGMPTLTNARLESFKKQHIILYNSSQEKSLNALDKEEYYKFFNREYVSVVNPFNAVMIKKDFQEDFKKLTKSTNAKVNTVVRERNLSKELIQRFVTIRTTNVGIYSSLGNIEINVRFSMIYDELNRELTKENLQTYFASGTDLGVAGLSHSLNTSTILATQELGLINIEYYQKLGKLFIKHIG